MGILDDYKIAMAAGQDAGSRHMRKHGRKEWNAADWNEAQAVTNRVFESLGTLPLEKIQSA